MLWKRKERKPRGLRKRKRKEMIEKAEYVYLLLRRNLIRVNLNELSAETPPPLEIMVEFQKHGLPVAMGAFILDSKLYMTGGEKVSKDANLDVMYLSDDVLDVSDGDDGLNSRVFVFDPSNPAAYFSPDHKIPPMRAAKPKPKVATIDGKVYVFASTPCYFIGALRYPAFECFDPATNSWEALPQPPCFHDGNDGTWSRICDVNRHFVLGRKIYIVTSLGLYSFDVDAQEWEDALVVYYEYTAASVPCPFGWESSITYGEDGLVIAYTSEGLVGYLYNADWTVKCHQVLHELNAVLHVSEEAPGFIHHLGDDKFCFVLSDVAHSDMSGWNVYVSTFQVKMQTSVEDEGEHFLTAVLLHSHLYDLYSVVGDYCVIRDVFIMSEYSKKRGLECVELDRSVKKQSWIG